MTSLALFSKSKSGGLSQALCSTGFVACLFFVMQNAEAALREDSALILKCGAED